MQQWQQLSAAGRQAGWQWPQSQGCTASVLTGNQEWGLKESVHYRAWPGLGCASVEQHRTQPSFLGLPVVAGGPDRINWQAGYGL